MRGFLNFQSYLILLICSVWIGAAMGQNQINAITYTTRDGLPNNNVISIAEDKEGFMLIGTASGLLRFDGVDFVALGREGTGDLPGDVFIYDIKVGEDAVWIKTELDGIFHWKPSVNHWTSFSKNSESKFKIPSNEIRGFDLVDEDLYFSCPQCGISKISPDSLQASINIDQSGSRYEDFGTVDSMLYMLTRDGVYTWQNKKKDVYQKMAPRNYVDLLISKDNMYVTTYENGIFEVSEGKLIHLSHNELDDWRSRIIGSKQNTLWATYRNVGPTSIDLTSGKMVSYKPRPFDSHSIPKALYNGGYIDSRGAIWLASSGGLICIPEQIQGFQHIDNEDGRTDYLLDVLRHESSGNYIAAFASNNHTIKVFNNALKPIANSDHRPNVKGIKSFFQLGEYEDRVFGMSEYLYEIDPLSGQVLSSSFAALKQFYYPRMFDIDVKGVLWMVTGDFRMIQYDLERNKIISIIDLPQFKSEINFQYMDMVSNEKIIVFATSSLLVLFEKETQKFRRFEMSSDGLSLASIPKLDSKIEDVFLQDESLILCSRSEGVFEVNLEGLRSNDRVPWRKKVTSIYSPTDIEGDESQYWVSSDNGLFLLDDSFHIQKQFTVQHGLDKSKLTLGSTRIGNKLFIDGEQSIVVGDTKKLKLKNELPRANISQAWINDSTLDLIEPIELRHFEKDFKVHITLPVFGNNFDYSYQYRLVGHNDKWLSRAISNNLFRYDNLTPGDYTFEIKAASNGNVGPLTAINFRIKPPIWATWYFRLALLGLIGLIVYMYSKFRMDKHLKDEKMKTTLAKLENTAIRSQLNPHFIFNSLNSIRSLILLDKKEHSISYVEQFSLLVREILQYSKLEYITLEQEIELNRKYLEIEKIRFAGRFEFLFDVKDDVLTDRLFVPPMIMQPFVENAIWHGLLHKDGDSVLKISILKRENQLEIRVKDNGIGRVQAKAMQGNKLNSTKSKLGIDLSNKRIKMLGKNAKIKIIDDHKDGQASGTTVIISIPLIDKDEEI